jgi:hypothetical protein
VARCRNCGYEIAFFDAPYRGDWKHLVSGEHQCGAEALVAQA